MQHEARGRTVSLRATPPIFPGRRDLRVRLTGGSGHEGNVSVTCGTIQGMQSQTSIPTPRLRLPLLGDLLSMDSRKPVQREMQMADELGGIFERKLLDHRLLVVSGADLVREVNDDETWAKFIGLPLRKLRSLGGDGLFTAFNSEPNWHKAHNILGPGFSQTAMRNYHGSMLEALENLTSSWDSAAEAGERVDVAQDMNRLTLDVIGLAGFSYRFNSFGKGEDPFVSAMWRALTHINKASNDLPILGSILGRKAERRHKADIELMHSVVDEVVATRTADSNGAKDLLDLMLRTVDPDTGTALDAVNVRNQVITFLIAGNETTAGTLAFALHFLSQHPDVADKIRDEVATVAQGGEPLTFDQVSKLRYTRRVVDETLRLWPAAPGYFRKVRRDTTLGGHPMPMGSWVFVLLPQLHRDPLWGPNPEAFDPDRFLPEQVKRRPPHIYKPWGTGLRACIGRQFALHESVLTLAVLMRRYDIESDPSYKLDIREAITLKPSGFELRIRRR